LGRCNWSWDGRKTATRISFNCGMKACAIGMIHNRSNFSIRFQQTVTSRYYFAISRLFLGFYVPGDRVMNRITISVLGIEVEIVNFGIWDQTSIREDSKKY